MAACRHKKRLQIYLDGWLNETQAAGFEEHLRKCADCQSELVDLEEVSSAALEIVDQAPEREYWENFATRVKNRILSRQASPYAERKRAGFRLKIASYSVSVIAVAAVLLLVFGRLSENPEIMVADDALSVTEVSQVAELPLVDGSGANGAVDEKATAVLSQDPVKSDRISETADDRTAPQYSSADDSSLPPDDGNELPEKAEASISGRDFTLAFRSPLKVNPASVSFSDNENFLSRLLAAYGGYSGDDFSVQPDVVTEGILSGYALGSNAGLERGRIASGHINGITGSEYWTSPGWGYLGLPGDTASVDELRLYLIELELMQLK